MRATIGAGSTILMAGMLLSACSSDTTAGVPHVAGTSVAPSTGGSGGSTQHKQGGSASGGGVTQACTLPVTHETDVGYHVGIPNGWDLSTLNGQIVIGSTPQDSEAVLIHPALLTNGLTPGSFFSTYLAALDQQNASAGAPVTTQPITGANGLPAVSFTQTVNGTTIQGVATVEVLPLAAPGATQEATFVSYWAPSDQLSSAAPELSAIAACYGPERANPARIFQDQVFTYAVPLGWTPMNENANGIDLHGPDGADVSYVQAGPVTSSQFDSPQTEIAWFTNGVGLENVTPLATVTTPQSTAANGGTQAAVYEQFDATFHGAPQRGLIYAYAVGGGNGITAGYVRVMVAPTADWNSLNGDLVQITGSIQHNFTQDLQTLQQVNRQWQDFSGQVANFDDVLNNQQLVRDPATGGLYEAPYAAYQSSGSQGPGYYLPNGDRLTPVSH